MSDPQPTPEQIAAAFEARAAAIMAMPLQRFRLCDECCADLERQRQRVGFGGCAVAYCDHNGMHGAWYQGLAIIQACASVAHAEAIDRELVALFELKQRLAHGPAAGDPDGGAGAPN